MRKSVSRFCFIILIISLSHLNIYSQVHQDWAVPYNGTANLRDEARDITVDRYGFVYVTGQSENLQTGGSSKDVVTIQYNPTGTAFQVRTYNGMFQNSWDAGNAIALDRSGNVYLAGYTQRSQENFDFLTLKYNAEDTNSVWGNTYDGFQFYDEAVKVITDDSGNVYVLGNSFDIKTDTNVYMTTLKYNTMGVLKWARKYKGQYRAYGKAMTLDRFGNVCVTGITQDFLNSDLNFVTIKYSTATGDSLWVQIYDPPGNDISSAIVTDNSGNVYVTGSSDSIFASDYTTIKYDPSGSTQWIRKYNGTANDSDVATCMAIDSSGNISVSGYSKNIGTGYDYTTVNYSSSGAQQWIFSFNGGGISIDRTYHTLLDNYENIYLTGIGVTDRSTTMYRTIKLSSSGDLLWETSFNVVGNIISIPTLAVDSMTNVYIAGSSDNDYITIKYSQTPNAPADLNLIPLGNGKIRLNWTDNSTNETNFKIQRKTNIDTNWIIKDSVPANITSWQDSGLVSGTTYFYRVYSSNISGNSAPTNTVNTIITNITGAMLTPLDFRLYQNHPNPFNPVTKIKFDIPKSITPVKMKLTIFDISGKKIVTLVNQEISSGSYEAEWDGVNYSSGIYYYTIEAGRYTETRKMLLLK